jgi:hypothetical protein
MTTIRPDPFDELRAADPMHGAPEPSDSKARVWARVQEDTFMVTPSPSEERRRNWVLGIGSVAITAVLLGAFMFRGAEPVPSQDPVGGVDGGAAGGGAAGICLAFGLEELAMRQFAFDGTVTAVDGDQVTFNVNEKFIGDLVSSVTLTAPDYAQTSLEGGVELVVGERYLVSGDEGTVWGCGFTQAYSDAAAAEWASVR